MGYENCPVCNRPYDDHTEKQKERCADEYARG